MLRTDLSDANGFEILSMVCSYEYVLGEMIMDKNIPKFLGIAYLIQFIGSLLSGILSDVAIGSGTISENLVSVSNNLLLMRTSIVAELVTCLGIILMTVFLYVVLEKVNRTIALVALSLWLIEVVFLVISSIGANALIPLSIEYVQAGSPDPSYMLTLGSLFLNLTEFSMIIHMLFFSIGGIFWYYLFYRSKKIPKFLALWGLVLLSLMPIDIVLALYGFGFDSIWRLISVIPYIPYLPFEGIMGLWFIFKGIDDSG